MPIKLNKLIKCTFIYNENMMDRLRYVKLKAGIFKDTSKKSPYVVSIPVGSSSRTCTYVATSWEDLF